MPREGIAAGVATRWEMPPDFGQALTVLQRPIKKVKQVDSDAAFEGATIGDLFNPVPPILAKADIRKFAAHHPEWFQITHKFKERNVHVGLEVEVENILKIDQQLPLCFWSIHEDGSLRNRGREFKTWPIPLQYTEPALNQLFASLNPDVDFSKRTSIHAHFDVRQLSPSQVLGMMYTYATVENLLFKYAGANRRNSIFCVPIVETDLLFREAQTPIRAFYSVLNSWQKYTAMNLKPIEILGTVEFRQMPGNNNIRKILIWLDLLSRLRVFAYRYPLKTITDKVAQLNTSSAYHHFVEDVFGELTVFLDTSALQADMEKACYLVKNSGITNEFHRKACTSFSDQSEFMSKIADNKHLRISATEALAINTLITRYTPSYQAESSQEKLRVILSNWDALSTLSRDRHEYRNYMDILQHFKKEKQRPF